MTNVQILTAIELLQARLTEDYEDIRQHSNEAGDAPCSEDDRDMFELYRDEIEQIESTIIALKADLYGLKEGELIIITLLPPTSTTKTTTGRTRSAVSKSAALSWITKKCASALPKMARSWNSKPSTPSTRRTAKRIPTKP